jgi:ParB family chromosome partitioning protein
VQINIERAYLKRDAENIEQSRAVIGLMEKHQYLQDRIEAGKQGKTPCLAGLGVWNFLF